MHARPVALATRGAPIMCGTLVCQALEVIRANVDELEGGGIVEDAEDEGEQSTEVELVDGVKASWKAEQHEPDDEELREIACLKQILIRYDEDPAAAAAMTAEGEGCDE